MNYFIDIEQFKEDTDAGMNYSEFLSEDSKKHRIYFSRQKTGFGFKHFLSCPECGSRRTKLYEYKGRFLCRCCYPYNVYKAIQNTSIGSSKYLSYMIKRFADKHGIKLLPGRFQYFDYERPKYKCERLWVDNLTVLQALENMRVQAILNRKNWSAKTIKSVLNWTNSLMYLFDLGDIREHFIDWDNGVDMNTKF